MAYGGFTEKLAASLERGWQACRQRVGDMDVDSSWDVKYELRDPRKLEAWTELVRAAKNQRIVGTLRSYLRPGQRVLEAGCGTGRLSVHLAVSYTHLTLPTKRIV